MDAGGVLDVVGDLSGLLDEPAAGLDDSETSELGDLVRRFANQYGMAVLLIEHDVDLVMGISDHVIVLHQGRKLFEGTPAEVQGSSAVRAAYLGADPGAGLGADHAAA